MKKIIFAFVVLLLLAGCDASKSVIFHTQSGNYKISAEIANTESAHEKGLMARNMLEKGHGMLFVYEEDALRAFWMKNTLIPLDMIFVDGAGKIINIVENAQPCKVDPCESYESVAPAKYVVEIAGGESAKHSITADNFVEFK